MRRAQTREAWARMLREHGLDESGDCCPGCRLELAASRIGFFSQTHQHRHDPGVVFIGLGIYEKTVLDKCLDSGGRATKSCRGRANDGHRAELLVQEVGWLGHDQVGLQSVAVEGFRIRFPLSSLEIRK